jgi:serine/threonine protein phosphatase 1
MKRFVTSDSHGGYKALVQCLERCGFDNEVDQLFYVGDVVDGWSEIPESIDLLLSIKNLVYILGNHDQWALEYYTGVLKEDTGEFTSWQHHGGLATRKAYNMQKMRQEHMNFLSHANLYHVTEDNILFVHAGFDPKTLLHETHSDVFLWDREFSSYHVTLHQNNCLIQCGNYKDIFIGHTPTLRFGMETPMLMGNVNMVDTGAAFNGKLSIIDIDTKEVWQSDKLKLLYPDEKGRNGFTWNEERKFLGI